jgi:hypothetical protein
MNRPEQLYSAMGLEKIIDDAFLEIKPQDDA